MAIVFQFTLDIIQSLVELDVKQKLWSIFHRTFSKYPFEIFLMVSNVVFDLRFILNVSEIIL